MKDSPNYFKLVVKFRFRFSVRPSSAKIGSTCHELEMVGDIGIIGDDVIFEVFFSENGCIGICR